MALHELVVDFLALLILFSEIRQFWRQWKEDEHPETKTMRTMLMRYAGERERMELDRDKWIRDVTEKYLEVQALKKKIALLRKHITPALLSEIDDSWDGDAKNA